MSKLLNRYHAFGSKNIGSLYTMIKKTKLFSSETYMTYKLY